ncbi:hypothetical protein [Sinorhizobium sp. Sb3]|uniref:hypothetical protein n=1 Tax=unclassified Ensifer TaxID=2633371 RepID=UPI00071D97A0|nr:hypothetical protein N183_35150 [Sinorhizobium sp. Sb3]
MGLAAWIGLWATHPYQNATLAGYVFRHPPRIFVGVGSVDQPFDDNGVAAGSKGEGTDDRLRLY